MKTRTKVLLSTLVAILLLAAAIAAGLNAVFTVTYVHAEFSTFSEEGNKDAKELRERLDKFVGKSSTFLDLGDVRELVAEYPHFSILSLNKKYPSTVEISVMERREMFAFEDSDGTYIFLDEGGAVLTTGNESIANRAGGQNILFQNFPLFVAETGEVSGDYFEQLMAAMSAFREVLSEVRANIVSVTLDIGILDGRNVAFQIQMTEGVVIRLDSPASHAGEKAMLAVSRYNTLADEQRLYGLLSAYETESGELRTAYVQRNPFES